ncbi:MAG: Uma2 family endonuclease [Hyphomicrobiaceae bacterium]
MANIAQKPLTPEEFFAWAERQDDRYELVDGLPVKMMTGASNFHDAIVINIIRELANQLRGKPCRPMTADTAIKTRIRNFRRPDVTVMCGPLLAKTYEASDPRLAIAVLSPSNEGVAWQRKLDEYRRLQGLRYILLIDSECVATTLYTRTATDWEPTDADDLDAVVELPEIDCRLALRDVYEGIAIGTAGA